MAPPCIGLNATQPPSANAGLMVTPSSVTCRSVRGKAVAMHVAAIPRRFLPSASSTFFQSMSWALAAVPIVAMAQIAST